MRLVYTRKYSQLESNELVNTALMEKKAQFAPKSIRNALKRITNDKNGKIKDNVYTNIVDSVRIWFMNFGNRLMLEKKGSKGSINEENENLLGNKEGIRFNSGSLLL